MSDKLRAVEELKRFGRQLKNVLELTDELERIGALENAAREAEANYALAVQDLLKVKEEEQKITARINALKEEVQDMDKIIENKQLMAEQDAQDRINRAKMEADNIIRKANDMLEEAKEAIKFIMEEVGSLERTRVALLEEINSLAKRKEMALVEARRIFEGQ